MYSFIEKIEFEKLDSAIQKAAEYQTENNTFTDVGIFALISSVINEPSAAEAQFIEKIKGVKDVVWKDDATPENIEAMAKCLESGGGVVGVNEKGIQFVYFSCTQSDQYIELVSYLKADENEYETELIFPYDICKI